MVGLPLSLVVTFLFSLIASFLRSPLTGVLFSTLPRTLIVSASPKSGHSSSPLLRSGEDKILLRWSLNQSFPAGTDSGYKTVRSVLCYAPASQADRPWRRTADDLAKDKTCPFTIAVQPYAGGASTSATFEYALDPSVPAGTYFVRAYVLGSGGGEVGYGQSTADGLLDIAGISGRCLALDVAAWGFSAFSVVALLVFLLAEKRNGGLPCSKGKEEYKH